MKNTLPSILLIASIAFGLYSTHAQTSVAGGTVSGNWTVSGSPYNVQGDIQIANGDSLTIQPGVVVSFQGTYKLLVSGKLKAVGTATDTIVFTATNHTAGWRGIRFSNTPTTNDTSRISYCRIEFGMATGTISDNSGGGLYFENYSKVVVSHSSITNCQAKANGGGIYVKSCSPVFTYNNISDNSMTIDALAGGCGMYLFLSSSYIANNTIANNKGPNTPACNGGGIFIESGSPTIVDNRITGNTLQSSCTGAGIFASSTSGLIKNNFIANNAAAQGGGIYYTSAFANPTITGNIISGNTAVASGGGIRITGRASITHNMIINNTAGTTGGGVYTYYDEFSLGNNTICNNTAQDGGGIWCNVASATASIYNNIVANNTAANGAGLSLNGSLVLCVNNTIVNNNATGNGGALWCTGKSPFFRNCILFGNTATGSGAQVYLNNEIADPHFLYSDVQGGTASFGLGTNYYSGTYLHNINAAPAFAAPTTGPGTAFNGSAANWNLQSSSPCINAGDPDTTYAPTDLAGNTRSVCSIDQGAYEYQALAKPHVGFTINNDTQCLFGNNFVFTDTTSATGTLTRKWNFGSGNTDTSNLAAPSKTYAAPGTYAVTLQVKDATNCTSIATDTVRIKPSPAKPVITATSATQLQSTMASGYQWFRNATLISGATAQTYTVTASGGYTVRGDSTNGCSNVSTLFNVTLPGLEELTDNNILTYPNPCTGLFNVLQANDNPFKISVMDASGRTVLQLSGMRNITIDMSTLENGVYYVKMLQAYGLERTAKVILIR